MILGAVLSFCESQLLSAILLLSGTSIKLESGKERRHGIHFSWHCYSSVKPLQVKNEICTFWFKSGLWSIVLSNTGARGDSEDHMLKFSFIIYSNRSPKVNWPWQSSHWSQPVFAFHSVCGKLLALGTSRSRSLLSVCPVPHGRSPLLHQYRSMLFL